MENQGDCKNPPDLRSNSANPENKKERVVAHRVAGKKGKRLLLRACQRFPAFDKNRFCRPLANCYTTALQENAFVKRSAIMSITVLLNDIPDHTADRKTDERMDDLIEKSKTLWAKLCAISAKLKRRFSR